MYKLIAISSILCFLAACSQKTQSNCAYQININAELECLYQNDLVEDVKYVPLKIVDDNYFIASIKNMFLSDSLIFIIDCVQNVIFVYDWAGNPLHQIGSVGQGPGEYITISNVDFDKENKHIIVGDASSRKILTYDLSGNLVSEKRLPDEHIRFFAKVPQSDLFAGERVNLKKNILVAFDNKKNIVHSDLIIDKDNIEAYKPYQGVASNSQFYVYNDTVFYLSIFDYAVYSYFDGKFNKEYCLNLPDKNKISKATGNRNSEMPPYEIISKYAENGLVCDFSSFIVTGKYIFFSIRGGHFLHYNILYNRQSETSYFYENLYSPRETGKLSQEMIKSYRYQPPIMAVYDNWCVFPINWESGLEYLKNNIGLKLEEDDNPVLCFVKLKK